MVWPPALVVQIWGAVGGSRTLLWPPCLSSPHRSKLFTVRPQFPLPTVGGALGL